MAEVSGTKIASFRGDIEDLRNGTIDRSTFNAARNEIVEQIGEAETKKLERRLRTELTQGGDDIGKSRPKKKPARSNTPEQLMNRLDKAASSEIKEERSKLGLGNNKGGMAKKKTGPMQMAMGGMANGRQHMYLSKGALVTDNLNPGLKALAKKRPDVVRKILKK